MSYYITSQTRSTQILKVYFLLKTQFLKIIGAQNQLPITFCSDLMTLSLKIRPSHMNF